MSEMGTEMSPSGLWKGWPRLYAFPAYMPIPVLGSDDKASHIPHSRYSLFDGDEYAKGKEDGPPPPFFFVSSVEEAAAAAAAVADEATNLLEGLQARSDSTTTAAHRCQRPATTRPCKGPHRIFSLVLSF
jgi:hypothetical protein